MMAKYKVEAVKEGGDVPLLLTCEETSTGGIMLAINGINFACLHENGTLLLFANVTFIDGVQCDNNSYIKVRKV